MKFVVQMAENNVGKEEHAGYQHFLFFRIAGFFFFLFFKIAFPHGLRNTPGNERLKY